MIKNLLFDLGGVIMNIRRQNCVDAFVELGLKDADSLLGEYSQAGVFAGIENGSLTPYGYEGYAYDRFTLELRYPFLLGNTTIYGLTFAEAGNAWNETKKFNPFDMKRSAGIGVRIFLPMVGLMGIDWAYGFDKVFGQKSGSQFHFILGQEF